MPRRPPALHPALQRQSARGAQRPHLLAEPDILIHGPELNGIQFLDLILIYLGIKTGRQPAVNAARAHWRLAKGAKFRWLRTRLKTRRCSAPASSRWQRHRRCRRILFNNPTSQAPAPELTIVLPTFKERDNVPLWWSSRTLSGVDWEVVFVDDNSPDGTARSRARSARRTAACAACAASAGAAFRAPASRACWRARRIRRRDGCGPAARRNAAPAMLERLRRRHRSRGREPLCATARRVPAFQREPRAGEPMSTAIARRLLGVDLSDPMSGFFMMRRDRFEELAPQLSSQGFKILLDIVATARGSLRIAEIAVRVRRAPAWREQARHARRARFRRAGAGQADQRHGVVPLPAVLPGRPHRHRDPHGGAAALHAPASASFGGADGRGLAAITWNFVLNNMFTYRDQRLAGWQFVTGLIVSGDLRGRRHLQCRHRKRDLQLRPGSGGSPGSAAP